MHIVHETDNKIGEEINRLSRYVSTFLAHVLVFKYVAIGSFGRLLLKYFNKTIIIQGIAQATYKTAFILYCFRWYQNNK